MNYKIAIKELIQLVEGYWTTDDLIKYVNDLIFQMQLLLR
jgi:hypothetical protein